MKHFVFVLAVAGLSLAINSTPVRADSVILNSGEIVVGRILSEGDGQVQVQVANSTHTITYTKTISKSDIKSIVRDTPEQKAEAQAWESLASLRLNQNQELTAQQYTDGIAAFEKFLSEYPKSQHADAVRPQLADWKAELANVESGRVKFDDKWMLPAEKAPLVEDWRKQQAVATAKATLQAANTKLSELQFQRKQLVENLGASQGKLQSTQTTLQNLQDTQEPIYNTTVSPFQPYWNGQLWISSGPTRTTQTFAGYKTVPNPDRPRLQADLIFYQTQVSQGQATLATLDDKIRTLKLDLPRLQANQDLAVANAAVKPVVAPPPAPAQPQPVAAAPVVAEQPSTTPSSPPPSMPTPKPQLPWPLIILGVCLLIVVYFIGRARAS